MVNWIIPIQTDCNTRSNFLLYYAWLLGVVSSFDVDVTSMYLVDKGQFYQSNRELANKPTPSAPNISYLCTCQGSFCAKKTWRKKLRKTLASRKQVCQVSILCSINAKTILCKKPAPFSASGRYFCKLHYTQYKEQPFWRMKWKGSFWLIQATFYNNIFTNRSCSK